MSLLPVDSQSLERSHISDDLVSQSGPSIWPTPSSNDASPPNTAATYLLHERTRQERTGPSLAGAHLSLPYGMNGDVLHAEENSSGPNMDLPSEDANAGRPTYYMNDVPDDVSRSFIEFIEPEAYV